MGLEFVEGHQIYLWKKNGIADVARLPTQADVNFRQVQHVVSLQQEA